MIQIMATITTVILLVMSYFIMQTHKELQTKLHGDSKKWCFFRGLVDK